MITDNFKTAQGNNIVTYSYEVSHAKADIYFVHGFGEHAQRYFNEAAHFNNDGFNFYSYDQQAHGQSYGSRRGYISNFPELINDFDEFLQMKRESNALPFFLMSHSMGGLVLVSYLLEKKNLGNGFKGLLLSAPLLQPNKDMAPLLQKISPLVAFILPKLKTVPLDPEHISRKVEEQRSYVDDPLNYTEGLYAKTGDVMLKQMKKIGPMFEYFIHPFIVQHGTDDNLAEYEGSRLLYEKSLSKDKSFVTLPDYRHEITRELECEVVLNNFSNWMKERV